MPNFNADCIGYPASGNVAHTHSVICGAPRGAKNQYQNCSYYGAASIQPTGTGYAAELSTRYYHGQIVSIGQ